MLILTAIQFPAAPWPPAGKAEGCSDERGTLKNAKRDAVCLMAATSLCFNGRAQAPAARLFLVIPRWSLRLLGYHFFFCFTFFRRMGALVPLQSPFLPNLLRPDLLRPKDNIAASRSFLPSAPCVS